VLRSEPLPSRRHCGVDLPLRRAGSLELLSPVLETRSSFAFTALINDPPSRSSAGASDGSCLKSSGSRSGFSSQQRRARLLEQGGRGRGIDELLAFSGERGDELLEFRKRHGSECGWQKQKDSTALIYISAVESV